jgi:hypothetical protein
METDDNVKLLVQLQKDMLKELRIQSGLLREMEDKLSAFRGLIPNVKTVEELGTELREITKERKS